MIEWMKAYFISKPLPNAIPTLSASCIVVLITSLLFIFIVLCLCLLICLSLTHTLTHQKLLPAGVWSWFCLVFPISWHRRVTICGEEKLSPFNRCSSAGNLQRAAWGNICLLSPSASLRWVDWSQADLDTQSQTCSLERTLRLAQTASLQVPHSHTLLIQHHLPFTPSSTPSIDGGRTRAPFLS